MRKLILLAIVGLGAQLVDGSLGMAYGVTSTTLLLAIGTNPAAASATVHLAEIGTTLISGASHWRFGNVDWKVVLKIGVPGAVGAFAGATFLSSLDTSVAAPVMSLILLALGLYVLVRFTVRGLRRDRLGHPLRKRFLGPARALRRVRRRHGRRRLGAGRHPRHPGQRPARAAQGHRLDRHQRVPRLAGGQHRLPARARVRRASTPPGSSPCSSVAPSRPRSPLGWCATSPRASSARGRRRHHPHQQPHPAAQRLGRRPRADAVCRVRLRSSSCGRPLWPTRCAPTSPSGTSTSRRQPPRMRSRPTPSARRSPTPPEARGLRAGAAAECRAG